MTKENRMKLKSLKLSGFKSMASSNNPNEILFGDVNVIIGANGSGKSNLVSFFEMLDMQMNGNLQLYIAQNGFAQTFLHYGPKNTKELKAELFFTDGVNKDYYKFKLRNAAGDILIFSEEIAEHKILDISNSFNLEFSSGGKESGIYNGVKNNDSEQDKIMHAILSSCRIFQFHDTSSESYMRRSTYIENERELYGDGSNLAPFLYTLKNSNEYRKYYDRIVKRIRIIMPQFSDFSLEPTSFGKDPHISLNWKSTSNFEYLLGPHQLSDGTLRFIALTTLLLQPPEKLPKIIIIDEPELGLHPAALSVLAGMIRTASQHSQIIIASQSTRLVDEFDCNDIIVAELDREEKSSKFKRLDEEKLKEWLEKYSLSELWEKNILGGQP